MERNYPIKDPEWRGVAPACNDAEWRWLEFAAALSRGSGAQKVEQKPLIVTTTQDPETYIETTAIQKQTWEGRLFGSKTHLCLTGDAAGYIAADTWQHRDRLAKYYDFHPSPLVQGVLMRPLLKKPVYKSEFMQDLNPTIDNLETWYVDMLIRCIRQAGYAVDEDLFRDTIDHAYEGLILSGSLTDEGGACVS